jgi:acetate---CoA ligase (ADP-forming)
LGIAPVSHRVGTLDALLKPKSIAVIGASQRRSRGTNVLLNLKKTGYTGTVYAINPRYDEVEGFSCFPTVSTVPEIVDCVVVAIPADGVAPALEDAYGAGTRGAAVLSSGFGEGGHADAERVGRLRALAARGMSICGPNCYGVLNVFTGAAAFSGGIAEPLLPGPVALISQSGGFTNAISDPLMEDRGIGFSYLISCGNQIGVSVEDYMEYLVDDPDTAVIAAFVEGFRKPDRLPVIGLRAREAGKPVIVLKSGRSEAGRAATLAHTGSLAGGAELLSSVLRRHGFVQVFGIDELIETIALFTTARLGLRFSRSMVAVTGSGGEGSHVADAAEEAGIEFVQLAESTKQRIEEILPEFGAATNPVDGTGAMFERAEVFESLMDAVLSDPNDGAVVVNLSLRDPGANGWAPMRGFARTLATKSRPSDRLMVAYSTSTLGQPDLEMLATLREAGIPFMAGTQHAMHALASLHGYGRSLELSNATAPNTAAALPDLPGGVLPFLQAREVLSGFGIPIIATALARTSEEAVGAARRIGYPVALKVEAPNLTHKTDAGAVVLDLEDGGAVRRAFESITARASEAGFSEISGVLVQPMSQFKLEAFAGVSVDPVVGPGVLFGLGGIFVELIRDVVIETPPLTIQVARDMIKGIRGAQIFAGVRGSRAADVEAVARILVGLGDFAIAYRDRLVAVDVNPILVGPAGEGAIAVDALVVLRDG